VVSGAGAAGTAVVRLLLAEGATDVVVYNSKGSLQRGVTGLSEDGAWLVEHTNASQFTGSLTQGLAGADVFIGVSTSGLLAGDDIATMARDAIVFALANPDPEVDPTEARRHAAVVATGRSDELNQINNVLAFPGVFRGLLDAGARSITTEMEIAVAKAIADVVKPAELNADFIVPSVFDPDVVTAVAGAVRAVAGA
ncbi:MAG: malic enzyme-like NAD(P)-binding protein, partial [Acidimicrobiales bacterium]